MSDERCEIWNLLHDGGIEKVERIGSDLRVLVSIRYLAELALPNSQCVLLTLQDCSIFEFTNWDSGAVTTEPENFEALDLDILSTDAETLPAQVTTTSGYLKVDYRALSMTLEDGSSLSFQQLCEIAEGYWDRFAKRSQARTQAADSQP